MDEKQLVINAKNGDMDAFCTLYSQYKDRLYRYAYYRTGVPEDAEDAVMDCVLSAFRQIGNIRKPEAFSAWLFTVLRASCNAVVKRQAKSRNTVDLSEVSDTFIVADDCAEKTELRRALDSLKEDEKEIVLLSVISGFSSKEIAKITDLTAGAVRSKLSRSLSKMRELLR